MQPLLTVPRSVIWRDSGRCVVTDDIFKKYHTAEAFKKLTLEQALVVTTEDRQHVRFPKDLMHPGEKRVKVRL